MSDCRIVYNEKTGLYRVERRGWMGWTFVMDEARHDYATFERYEDARRFACEAQERRATRQHRRWKVVDFCRDRRAAN